MLDQELARVLPDDRCRPLDEAGGRRQLHQMTGLLQVADGRVGIRHDPAPRREVRVVEEVHRELGVGDLTRHPGAVEGREPLRRRARGKCRLEERAQLLVVLGAGCAHR